MNETKKVNATKFARLTALVFSVLLAATGLASIIYGFILLAYVVSAPVLTLFFGCGLLAVGLSVALFSVFSEGIDNKKLSTKKIRNLARPPFVAGVVLFCVALAFGGFTFETWLDDTRDLRDEYGYHRDFIEVVLRYDEVSSVECDSELVTSQLSDGVLTVQYTEKFDGQFVISRSPDGIITIVKAQIPDYPSPVWWAF